MTKICGKCVYYRNHCCTNNDTLCLDNSGYIDKQETIKADIAIDDIKNTVQIVIGGDYIKDYETFGKDLFENVRTFIKKAMQRGLYQ